MKRLKVSLVLAGVVLLAWSSMVSAAVFQYSITIENPKRPGEAFLWIPPEAPQVRGILVSSMILMEKHMSVDPQIRKACADQGIAILFMIRGPGEMGLTGLLEKFASISGYQELPYAPLMFVGHSAGGPGAQKSAANMADRCFGLVQYRGGVPGGGEKPVPGEVPSLTMVGQFDEFGGVMRDEKGWEGPWERAVRDIAAYRAQDQGNLASVVVEPGAGHYAWSDRNAAYLALFIRKAAAARIPDWKPDVTEPVTCRKVDPSSGWLTSLDLRKIADIPPASVADYTGDKAHASWHFDRELAEANVAYHRGLCAKKDQFIKWKDPYWVDGGSRYFFTKLTWVDDGQTLEVHPVYADKYPQHIQGGPQWLEAGQPVGHAEAPILVKAVSGPMVPTGEHKLRIQFDNVNPASDFGRPTFMAYSVGDDTYRYTEQVGMMPRGFNALKAGKPQTISFEPIGNLKANGAPVELKATSDAGVPVEFYVAIGPADVIDGRLTITELPKRATYPITVRVVAYQFGRGIEPLVQTAGPVEQTILIEKP